MALTIHQEAGKGREQRHGNETVLDLRVDADSSYPTGGYPLDYAQLKPHILTLYFVEFMGGNLHGGGAYMLRYDRAARKLMFYTAPGAEVGNATDLSTVIDIGIRFRGLP